MASRVVLLLKTAVFTLIFLFSSNSFAQITAHNSYLTALSPDAHDRSRLAYNAIPASKISADSAAALNISREHSRLVNYLKALGIPDEERRPNKKFYYHMANVFARLRLYPLAMKCFFKAAGSDDRRMDSLYLSARKSGLGKTDDKASSDYAALELSSKDDSVVSSKAIVLKAESGKKRQIKKSKRTSFPQILNNFNDGKEAVAYALLFHVKQPAPGKRKIFVGVNTGHTFITLIKYNADSTYASASFGFYPDKDQMLSATPFAPTTSATFKDDAAHLWDEVLGKFISRRNFIKILDLTQKFEGMTYNLNKQNCTDFGLKAAGLAGIHITDTFGKWPLGKGNNPAVTGQSILMRRISTESTLNDGEFFMDETVTGVEGLKL
ncbi:MAG: hypothetical protein ABWY16_15520 [Pedobacter sp.]|uniref:hypothetical protein n=1 Tax=Pedobacter sp. TaxID=1411316 RepID=UPI003395CBC7